VGVIDPETLDALLSGEAFADISAWRKIAVSGGDAFAWLNDLVSADLGLMTPGTARRSLLLSPTGQVRASFTVAVFNSELLLLQDPAQPHGVGELLDRYVLSSDVVLRDRSGELALFALPHRSLAPGAVPASISSPSCVGSGVDLVGMMENHDDLVTLLEGGLLRQVSLEDLEAWRVIAGIPKFGVDVTEEDLPQEGGVETAVSFDKGCYLGQETIAKVRNLGHPRRLLVHAETSADVSRGDPVFAHGVKVGTVTSAARATNATRALVKVRWDARHEPLAAQSGAALTPVVADESVRS
jgi:tRNA-modifying protein YgfZ